MARENISVDKKKLILKISILVASVNLAVNPIGIVCFNFTTFLIHLIDQSSTGGAQICRFKMFILWENIQDIAIVTGPWGIYLYTQHAFVAPFQPHWCNHLYLHLYYCRQHILGWRSTSANFVSVNLHINRACIVIKSVYTLKNGLKRKSAIPIWATKIGFHHSHFQNQVEALSYS